MRGCVLRRVLVLGLVLAGLVAGAVQAADDGTARDGDNAWLAVISGPAAASETVLAADMASLFPQGGLGILSMLGDAGAGNLALLSELKVDLAFVATSVLAEAAVRDTTLPEAVASGHPRSSLGG